MRTTATLTSDDLAKDAWYDIPSGPNVVVPARIARRFRLVLTSNATLAVQGGSGGQEFILQVIQGGAGSFTLTFGSSLTLNTTAGSSSFLRFVCDDQATTPSWAVSGSSVAGGGSGTVTSVSVVTANGVSGSVATSTTTPAITLTLGAITPSTVNGNTITTGTGTLTLANALITSGANSLTLTTTGATNITLPTAGTVATRAGAELITGKSMGMWNYAADNQANDDYVITLSPAISSLETGQVVIFKAKTANTTASTLNVNGLGAKALIKRQATALATGDILANMFCMCVYDGTSFVLMNPVVN